MTILGLASDKTTSLMIFGLNGRKIIALILFYFRYHCYYCRHVRCKVNVALISLLLQIRSPSQQTSESSGGELHILASLF